MDNPPDGNPKPSAIGSLLIVDDRRAFCEGLETLFRATHELAVQSSAAAHAVATVHQMRPAVVLLGALPGGISAREMALDIRQAWTAVRIIVLETTSSRWDRRALAEMVVDFLPWTASFQAIEQSVRRAFRDASEPPISVPHFRLELPSTASPLDRLSPRELQVLRLLVQGHSVRECATRLNRSESTIDNHKTRIMRKLGCHTTVHLTRLAIREGLIQPD